MATYKDPANLTFNPYVEQRPVEAMLKVGMYKQERYDQGVQKIQESIDNIAGLDVVRDVDKQYLQSKLNQLGSQLSMVAGGDFSNFQLVNSVNGMTNQIVKDPNVINSVASSARYRKALEEKQKIVQEGKGSASNDWMFNNEANAWLNSNDINAQYNGMYRPYRDYNKSAQDIVKNLAKDYTENDIAFGPNGEILDAITRRKVEGISPEKIQAALKAGLSADDWQQMQIDGRYKYSNVSADGFVNDLNSQYSNTFDGYAQERDRLTALKNAAASSVERQRLQNEIEGLDRTIGNLKSEYNSISAGFESGDVESAKAQLYTTNWMDTFSNSFSSSGTSSTVRVNPYAQQAMERAKMRQDQLNRDRKYLQDERHNAARIKVDQERNRLLGDAKYGPISIPTAKEKTAIEVVQTVNSNLAAAIERENMLAGNYESKYGVTPEQFEIDLEAYTKNPTSVSLDKRMDLDAYLRQKRIVDSQDALVRQTEAESRLLYNEQIQSLVPDNLKTATIEGYGVADAAVLFDKFDKTYLKQSVKYKRDGMPGAGTGTPVITYGEEQAEQDYRNGELSGAEYGLYLLWADNKKGQLDNEMLRSINSIARRAGGIEDDRIEYLKNTYEGSTLVPQEQASRIPVASAEDKDAFVSGPLASLAITVDRLGGLPNAPGVTSNAINEIATNLKTAAVTTDGAGSYSIYIADDDGNALTIPLTQQQYDEAFLGRYETDPNVGAFNENYLTQMLATYAELKETTTPQGEKVYYKDPNKFYSTSKDGKYKTTVDNAFLSGPIDFPNVQYYGVSGNIVSDMKPTEDGLFKLQLNVYDPTQEKYVEEGFLVPATLDKSSVVPTLQQLTDEVIWQLLNNTEKDMPLETLIELQKASEKMQ